MRAKGELPMTMDDVSGGTAAPVSEPVRPLKGPFTRVKWAMWATIALNVIALPVLSFEIWVLNGGLNWLLSVDPELTVYTLVFGVFGLAYLAAYLLSVIFVSLWTFRAMKNLHTVKSRVAEMSPGWSVGWYFIPFANLWQPFKGMSQIWHGSHDQNGLNAPSNTALNWWWALWIISNIVSNVSLRLGGLDGSGPSLEASLWLDLGSSVTMVICAVLLISITRRVTTLQTSMEGGAMANVFD